MLFFGLLLLVKFIVAVMIVNFYFFFRTMRYNFFNENHPYSVWSIDCDKAHFTELFINWEKAYELTFETFRQKFIFCVCICFDFLWESKKFPHINFRWENMPCKRCKTKQRKYSWNRISIWETNGQIKENINRWTWELRHRNYL